MSEYSEADQCADRHDNDGGRRGPHHRIPHLDLHNARTSAWVLLATSAMALGAFLAADDKMTAAALAVAAVLLGWASASERGEWLEREQHEAEGADLDVWRGVWS